MTSPIASLKQKQGLLRILIFSLVTIMIWVGFSIFHSQNTTAISPDLLKLAEPLNPNINVDALQRIEQKRSFGPNDLANFPINRIVVQTDGTEQVVRGTGDLLSLIATRSASPSPSPVLTPVQPVVPVATASAKKP